MPSSQLKWVFTTNIIMSFKCIQRFAIKMVVERLVKTACIYKGVRNKPCSTHRWWCSSDQPNLWGENVKRHVSQWFVYWLLYLFIYWLIDWTHACFLFFFPFTISFFIFPMAIHSHFGFDSCMMPENTL